MRIFSLILLALCTALGHAMEKDEYDKVVKLIDKVKSMEDCRFIRNGKEYGVGDAASLMKYKLNDQQDKLKDVSDYIDKCLTKSSTTGIEYKIKGKDGTIRPSAVVLREWYTEMVNKAIAITNETITNGSRHLGPRIGVDILAQRSDENASLAKNSIEGCLSVELPRDLDKRAG